MLHTKGGENMACMNVGARIRYFRRLRGLSQEQLALPAGINTAFQGHLERSLKSPTITTLEKIVKALNITLGELFADEPDTPIPARNAAMERLQLLVRDLSLRNSWTGSPISFSWFWRSRKGLVRQSITGLYQILIRKIILKLHQSPIDRGQKQRYMTFDPNAS